MTPAERREVSCIMLLICALLALASLYQGEHREQYRGVVVPIMPKGY